MAVTAMTQGGRETLHQFGCPRGRIGWLVGQVMALKNGAMNRAALAHLDLEPSVRALEIGFGPGKTLGWVARQLTDGRVAGLDHSEVMVRQATRRNRRLIDRGRVEVRCGGVSEIPYPTAHFDRVFAVNSFQFWPRPVEDLAEVWRVTRPGGKVVLVIRAADRPLRFDPADAGGGMARVERARQAVTAAGFEDIVVTGHRAGRLLAVAVVGRRPSGGDETGI